MRIAFQHGTIHKSAGVALVGIDDHVFGVAGRLARRFPFNAGRKTAATASAQARFLDFPDHRVRRHLEQRLGQRRIAAQRQIVVDALGINLDVVADDVPFLMLVERNVGLAYGLHILDGIEIDQTLDNLLFLDGLRDDLRHLFRRHPQIAGLVRIHDDDRPALAETGTAGALDLDLARQSFIFDFFVECVDHLGRAGRETAGARAYRNAGFLGFAFRQDVLPKLFQFSGRIQHGKRVSSLVVL